MAWRRLRLRCASVILLPAIRADMGRGGRRSSPLLAPFLGFGGEFGTGEVIADVAVEEPAFRERRAEGLGDVRRHGRIAIAPPADELDIERPAGGVVIEAADHGRGHACETRECAEGARLPRARWRSAPP